MRKMPYRAWVFIYVLLLLVSCDSSRVVVYGGKLESGLLFYPTTTVEFDKISLSESMESQRGIKGLDHSDLQMHLVVRSSKKVDYIDASSEMKEIGVEISIRILQDGIVYRSIDMGEIGKIMKLSAVGDRVFYWHEELIDLEFESNKKYDIKIVTKIRNPSLISTSIVPIIEGGGIGYGDVY